MKDDTAKQGEFRLTLNLMVQNLLISALSTCKFVLGHATHPITEAIKQFKLIDPDHLDRFIEEVKSGKPGQVMILTLADELLIYTAFDITGKVYLTDLGDRMEQLNAKQLQGTNADFATIRSTLLKGCQFVMNGMRESLSDVPEFEDRVDILDNYILVG